MKTYIYQDEKSHKFWAVEQQGNELNISWGKVGTNRRGSMRSRLDRLWRGSVWLSAWARPWRRC